MADVALRPSATPTAPEHKPPLDQTDAIASLLSLAFAEGRGGAHLPEQPLGVPVKQESSPQQSITVTCPTAPPSTSVPLSTSLSSGGKHHRRLSSTGKTRRRLSDAREAATRPSPSLLQSSPAALSLASLTLSSSPPSSYPAQASTSFSGASRTLAPAPPKEAPGSSNDNSISPQSGANEDEKDAGIPIPTSTGRTGKKRGMDHRCESCSKIYRHPSCLIKHRWEHTPHWREASKFVLSKHQQVQLLEAAAILSHMSSAASGGRSLPEDRSLWPSFLSGGSLPPPEPPIPTSRSSGGQDSTHGAISAPSPSYVSHPVSSSVPARSTSTGPRLHDYGVRPGVVTQVRPGLIGVTTNTSTGGVAVIGERGSSTAPSSEAGPTSSQPVPVPSGNSSGNRHAHDAFGSVGSTGYPAHYRNQHSYGGSESWGSYGYGSGPGQHGASLVGYPYSNGVAGANDGSIASGGWSLPRSSVRSASSPARSQVYSRSRSRSTSNDRSGRAHRAMGSGGSDSPPSDDESVDADAMLEDDAVRDVRDKNRDVNIVIEEEEDDEEGGDGVISGIARANVPRKEYGGAGYEGHYPHLGRPSYRSSGRRTRGMPDEEDVMGRHLRLREEDEEMDEVDPAPRPRKVAGARADEWDGMEMEMDMD